MLRFIFLVIALNVCTSVNAQYPTRRVDYPNFFGSPESSRGVLTLPNSANLVYGENFSSFESGSIAYISYPGIAPVYVSVGIQFNNQFGQFETVGNSVIVDALVYNDGVFLLCNGTAGLTQVSYVVKTTLEGVHVESRILPYLNGKWTKANDFMIDTSGDLLIVGVGGESNGADGEGFLMVTSADNFQNDIIDVETDYQVNGINIREVSKIVKDRNGDYVLIAYYIDEIACFLTPSGGRHPVIFRLENYRPKQGEANRKIFLTDTEESYFDIEVSENGNIIVGGTSYFHCFDNVNNGPDNVVGPDDRDWIIDFYSDNLQDYNVVILEATVSSVTSQLRNVVALEPRCGTNEFFILYDLKNHSGSQGHEIDLWSLDDFSSTLFHTRDNGYSPTFSVQPSDLAQDKNTGELQISYTLKSSTLDGNIFSMRMELYGVSDSNSECADPCAGDYVIPCGGSMYLFSNRGYGDDYSSHQYNGCNDVVSNVGGDIVFRIDKPTDEGFLFVDLWSDNFNLFVYRECPSDTVCAVGRLNGSRKTAGLIASAGTYYAVVDGNIDTDRSFDISVSCGVLDCQDAVPISCGTFVNYNMPRYSLDQRSDVSFYRYLNEINGWGGMDGVEQVFEVNVTEERVYTIDVEMRPDQTFDMFLLKKCDSDSVINSSVFSQNTPRPGNMIGKKMVAPLSPGTYYLVIEGYQQTYGNYKLSVECCDPDFTNVKLNYNYLGNDPGDLSYRFFNQNYDPSLVEVPILVNGQPANPIINPSNGAFDLTFSEEGDYTICYPAPSVVGELQGSEQSSDCNYVYYCMEACIEYRPTNLAGLINCNECECVQNDPYLPDPFLCEGFSSYEDIDDLFGYYAPNEWSGNIESNIFSQQVGAGKYLSMAASNSDQAMSINIPDGVGNHPERGRYRISLQIRVWGEGGYAVKNSNTELFYLIMHPSNSVLDTEEGLLVGGIGNNETIRFQYTEGQWLNVVHIVEPGGIFEFFVVHTFIDGNYIGTVRRITSPTFLELATIEFTGYFGALNMDVDQICIRTQDYDYAEQCVSDGSRVCLPFNEEYPNICAANAEGLFSVVETENCFTICDYGGPQIFRSDGGGLISGSLTNNEITPPGIYQDDCIEDFFRFQLGQVPPELLYADIYVYENDGGPTISIDNLPPGFYGFLYQCFCDDEVCDQTCNGRGTTSADALGLYYVVIISEQLGDYSFSIGPENEQCSISPDDIIVCQEPDLVPTLIPGTFPPGLGRFSPTDGSISGECYQGFRDYALSERVYRLQLDFPAIVNFNLEISNGIAGLFVFESSCNRECISYADTRIFDTSTSLDSIRMEPGYYYLLLDQEKPVSNFILSIQCLYDFENADGGINVIVLDDAAECTIDNNSSQSLSISSEAWIRFVDTSFSQSSITPKVYLQPVVLEEGNLARVYPLNNGLEFLSNSSSLNYLLSTQAEPDTLAYRCGWLPGDSIGLTVGTGTLVREVVATYQGEGRNNTGFFESGTSSTITSLRAISTTNLAPSKSTLVMNASGRIEGQLFVNGNTPFKVKSLTDWLSVESRGVDSVNYPNSNFRVVNIVYNSDNAYSSPTDRVGKIRISSATTDGDAPKVVQTVNIIQKIECNETRFFMSSPSVICKGDSVYLEFTDDGGNSEDFNILYDVFINGEIVSDYTLSPIVSGQYDVIVRSTTCNEEADTSVFIEVVDRPWISYDPPTIDNCSSDTSMYTVNFTSNAERVTRNNVRLNAINGTYTLTVPAREDITLMLENEGCSEPAVIVAPDCSCPDFVPIPLPVESIYRYCEGDNPPMIEILSNSNLRVNWYSADGELVQSGMERSYQTPGPGVYLVELADERFTACRSAFRVAIIVEKLSIISTPFSSERTVCRGETISFEMESTINGVPLSFIWDHGQSNAATYSVPTQSLSEGWHDLTLEVGYASDATCTQIFSTRYYIIPKPRLEPVAIIDPCAPDFQTYSVRFNSSDEVSVNVGRLETLANGQFQVVDVLISDTLRVSLTASANEVYCRDTIEFTPPICECPSNTVSYSIDEDNFVYCANDDPPMLMFRAPQTGFALAFFRAGSTEQLFSNGQEFTPPGPGNYMIKIISPADFNCLGQSSTSFTVDTIPTPIARAGEDLLICPGQSVTLNGNNSIGQGMTRFSWTGPAGLTNQTSPTPAFTSSVPGRYTIYLNFTAGNCTDQDSVVVEVSSLPEASFNVDDPLLCNGDDNGQVTVEPYGGIPPYNFLWSTQDITSTIRRLEAGNYSVTITDSLGCIAVNTIDFEEPLPLELEDSMIVGSNGFGSTGSITVAFSGGTRPYTYELRLNGNFLRALTDSIATDLPDGTGFSIRVVDANGCEFTTGDYTVPLITSSFDTPDSIVEFDVFPNPTTGNTTVRFRLTAATSTEIIVYTLMGRKVLQLPLIDKISDSVELLTENLPAGTYFVRLGTQNGLVLKKLVKL